MAFAPTDTGQNTASKRGMIPEGAEPWGSPMDEEFSVTLTISGVYRYVCLPHCKIGMVGLIVVGEGMSNLDEAYQVDHPKTARAAFRVLLENLTARSH